MSDNSQNDETPLTPEQQENDFISILGEKNFDKAKYRLDAQKLQNIGMPLDILNPMAYKKDDDNDEMASPTMKLCPICSVMNAQTNRFCHICGYDFFDEIMQTQKKRKLPAIVDGELVLLDDDLLDIRNKKQNVEMIEENNTHDTVALTKKEKMKILKNGLEYNNNFFDRAKKNYL